MRKTFFRLFWLLLSAALPLFSQQLPDANAPADQPEVGAMLPHTEKSRFWISGQANFIFQAHPAFSAKYSGTNSLDAKYEKATSRVYTLYTGLQINNSTDLLVDFESAGGRGLSDALGVAGFFNLDVVRNPALGSKPYVARFMVHHVFRLSDKEVSAERGQLSLATHLPERRLEVWGGKLSTADFFDLNSVGSDSHLQFMNWTVDNNGAYDYAADTRGYTYGAVASYRDHSWGLLFGELLMPQVANGIDIEFNLRKAHSENLQFDTRHEFLSHRATVVRVLGYLNHANMGLYRQAIEQFQSGLTSVPDITAHPRWSRVKYGYGLNLEQELARDVTAYARYGWNDGKTESFAYTEVDNTIAFGVTVRGTRWSRSHDRAGVAFVNNGISSDHREYLALGGVGFLLGDGGLNYGRERIEEGYYRMHLWRGIYAGPDIQYVQDPGYNRDRGPVIVPGFRLHIEI